MNSLEVALHKVATITMGTSPKGTTYNRDRIGLPLLNGPTEFGESHPHCTLYTTDSKKECKTHDLIFCVRASTGRMNWADQTYSLGRGVCSIRGATLLDTRFIRYGIEWKLQELLNLAGGSTFSNLTKDLIRDFPIPYPESRHKIAAILGAYDDLIENNSRRIKILEEMAATIYHEWFVKFRFPGHENVKMVESELGLIPQGWAVVKTEHIVKRVASGKKYDQATVELKGSVPVLDQGRSGIIGYHSDSPGVNASEDEPIIVFANHTCYQRIIQYPFSAIQNVLPFLPHPERHRDIYWLHWATKDLIDINDYKGHWPEFMSKKLVLPPTKVCKKFGELVKPMMRLVFKLERCNQNIRETRDLLLPKLIHGELDVSELDIDADPHRLQEGEKSYAI